MYYCDVVFLTPIPRLKQPLSNHEIPNQELALNPDPSRHLADIPSLQVAIITRVYYTPKPPRHVFYIYIYIYIHTRYT